MYVLFLWSPLYLMQNRTATHLTDVLIYHPQFNIIILGTGQYFLYSSGMNGLICFLQYVNRWLQLTNTLNLGVHPFPLLLNTWPEATITTLSPYLTVLHIRGAEVSGWDKSTFTQEKRGEKECNQILESEASQVCPALDSCTHRHSHSSLCPSVSFCLCFISLCFCTSPLSPRSLQLCISHCISLVVSVWQKKMRSCSRQQWG